MNQLMPNHSTKAKRQIAATAPPDLARKFREFAFDESAAMRWQESREMEAAIWTSSW
jgi:hypothetical protein